jgi:hypothetical protein
MGLSGTLPTAHVPESMAIVKHERWKVAPGPIGFVLHDGRRLEYWNDGILECWDISPTARFSEIGFVLHNRLIVGRPSRPTSSM